MPAIRILIQGQSFDAPLPEAPVRIGKSADADLCIQGGGVGGEHCVLEPLGGGRTKLKDLGSGYETLVNGVAVKQISLNDGDLIEVGEAKITYLATAAGAPEPQPEAIPEAPRKPTAARKPAKPAKPTPAKPAAAAPAKPKAATPPTGAASETPAPQAASAEAASAQAASTEAADAAATPDEAKAKRDEAVVRESAPRPRRSKVPMVGLLTGALILVGVFFFMNGLSGGGGDRSFADAVKRGHRQYEDQAYDAALATFRDVIARAPEGQAKRDAQDGLALVGAIEREMAGKLERLQGEALDLTPEMVASERRRFLTNYGDAQGARFDAVRASMLSAQVEWKAQNLDATRAIAAMHEDKNAFVKARDAWQTLGAKSPPAIDVRSEVAEALAALDTVASAKADELIARAAAWNKRGTPSRSVKLLQDMLPHFVGFPAEARLKAAHALAIEEHKKPIEFTPTQPDRPRPDRPRPDRPGPDRPRPDTPVDLDREAAAKKQADAILAAAAEEAQARRFRDAAAKLATDARVLPEGSMQRVRLDGIAADYGLAAKAKDLLVAHIKAHPDHYGNVRLAPRLKVALIDADAEYLHAKVSGGRSKHAWARLPADAWISLVKRMRPEQDGCVPAAALLHVLAREPEAERMLVTAVEKGVSTDEVFARLARWRGIAMPEGGFVIHDGRYVTPAEREHLLREAQIKTAIAQLDSRKPEEREAAAKTLLEIGEPAQARFAEALERRRAYLLDEIVRSKSFSSGKYKSKLLQLLEERRKHALALIYDAAAYPYPNPQKRNQAEVEARVDKVREVWERPFDLVSQWDKKLQERIQGLTEVDSLLSQVMPGYQPELDELKERINKAIDVPGSADPSKREYSLKVIVYNTTLKTTAGTQEKANVRSVNNYRMMMGLLAVKIDEKLTRAARGHSRHMATNGYFAHNVPPPYHTPTNRTPGSRAKQQGFGGGVGENIARGPGTGHGAFMAWFRSSGHHRNMLGRGWLVMGCGRANQTWWTQLFAGGSKSLTPPDPLPPPAAPFAPDDDGKAKPGDKNGRGSEDDAE